MNWPWLTAANTISVASLSRLGSAASSAIVSKSSFGTCRMSATSRFFSSRACLITSSVRLSFSDQSSKHGKAHQRLLTTLLVLQARKGLYYSLMDKLTLGNVRRCCDYVTYNISPNHTQISQYIIKIWNNRKSFKRKYHRIFLFSYHLELAKGV